MPQARWQSGKIKKRAYQGKQEEKKVCPKRAGRAEESRKGHTKESKQGSSLFLGVNSNLPLGFYLLSG